MEADDLTSLVIRAMGMILGRLIKDEASTTSTTSTISTTTNKSYFVPTYLVTGAVQTLIEAFEYDYQLDQVTNTKVGKTLTKMRLVSKRGSNGGKRGWIITLGELIKWAGSYGLDPSEITGINLSTLGTSGTSGTPGTSGTARQSVFEGIL